MHDKVYTIVPSLLPQQMPVLAAYMWQHGLEQGHNSILWNLNTTMHFMVAKGKMVKDKIQKNLSRAIF